MIGFLHLDAESLAYVAKLIMIVGLCQVGLVVLCCVVVDLDEMSLQLLIVSYV